jgi:hypothetical protein
MSSHKSLIYLVTPYIPKYKYLLTYADIIRLIQKIYENIIYFVMTCFVIVYICSIS